MITVGNVTPTVQRPETVESKAEIDSFGFVPPKGVIGRSSTDNLFGNIRAARVLLAETTPESFGTNQPHIERILERAASWFSQVIPLDGTDDNGAVRKPNACPYHDPRNAD